MGFVLGIATGAGVLVVGGIYLGIGPSMSRCGKGCGDGGVGSDIGQSLVPTLIGVVICCITVLSGGGAGVRGGFALVDQLGCQGLAVAILKGDGVCRGG